MENEGFIELSSCFELLRHALPPAEQLAEYGLVMLAHFPRFARPSAGGSSARGLCLAAALITLMFMVRRFPCQVA